MKIRKALTGSIPADGQPLDSGAVDWGFDDYEYEDYYEVEEPKLTKYVGVVGAIYEKQFSGKLSVSFRIDGSPLYFRTGAHRYPGVVEKGNTVEFEAEENSDGKSATVRGSVAAGRNQPRPSSGGSRDSGAVDWAKKDASIQYQSSRKDALELTALLVSSGALKLPADAAKKVAVLEACLDRYTAQFYQDIAELGAVQRTSTEETQESEQYEEEE